MLFSYVSAALTHILFKPEIESGAGQLTWHGLCIDV